MVPIESSLHIGKIEHGHTTQKSEDEVLGYKDLPAEAYEFSALLRLGTTYELMDFLARAQVARSYGRGTRGVKNDPMRPNGRPRTSGGSSLAKDRSEEAAKERFPPHGATRSERGC